MEDKYEKWGVFMVDKGGVEGLCDVLRDDGDALKPRRTLVLDADMEGVAVIMRD